MSHYVHIQRKENEPSNYHSLVPLQKAKVSLGSRATKQLARLGQNIEGLMVSDIFKELSQKQQKNIDNNIPVEMDGAFQGMKKKLEGYAHQRKSTVFFKEKEPVKPLRLPVYLQDNNQQLQRKFANHISTRLQAIQETTKIQNQKRKMRSWGNYQFNSRTKSPNFSRMVFLLESLGKKNIGLEELGNGTRSEPFGMSGLLGAKKFRL